MATSLERGTQIRPFHEMTMAGSYHTLRDPEQNMAPVVWSDMPPECMELLQGFDLGRQSNLTAHAMPSSAPPDLTSTWSAGTVRQGTGSEPIEAKPSASLVHYQNNLKRDRESDGTIEILGLNKKTERATPAGPPPKAKTKRAVVSPPSRVVKSEPIKQKKPSPSTSRQGKASDVGSLADKRARNKIAAEKSRRKRLAKVASTEAENTELKTRVEFLEGQLRNIKEAMRRVIAETEGGKRNPGNVPVLLMNILMEL